VYNSSPQKAFLSALTLNILILIFYPVDNDGVINRYYENLPWLLVFRY